MSDFFYNKVKGIENSILVEIYKRMDAEYKLASGQKEDDMRKVVNRDNWMMDGNLRKVIEDDKWLDLIEADRNNLVNEYYEFNWDVVQPDGTTPAERRDNWVAGVTMLARELDPNLTIGTAINVKWVECSDEEYELFYEWVVESRSEEEYGLDEGDYE
jgi:hypothetical protein